jgi:protease-4
MVLVLVGIIVIASLSGGDEVLVKENSVLRLDLNVPIIEIEREDPFAAFSIFGASSRKPIGLAQLRQTIEYAKLDPKIKGIYLNISYPMTGYAIIEEIRQSLLDFRKEGKWVVAYSEFMSEPAYYLASAADKVYLNPQGEVEFNGLAIEISFNVFDKLEISLRSFGWENSKAQWNPSFSKR